MMSIILRGCCLLVVLNVLLLMGEETGSITEIINDISKDSVVSVEMQEIIAIGEKHTDSRLLNATTSVIESDQLLMRNENNILPVLNKSVPGLFITNRGVMGYGVSAGGSGNIKVRGVGGSPNTGLLILIDGMPQYAGLYGHPVADNYQTFMVDMVEVVKGPASMLFGSNAMGGVINITTKSLHRDTAITDLHLEGGSYYTIDAGFTNQLKKNKFSSNLGFNYVRTDGHRDNMKFDEYNAFMRMEYDFNSYWRGSILGNLVYFNSSNPGSVYSPLEDNDMHIMRGTASFTINNEYEKTSGFLSVYYNGGHHKIEGDPSYFIKNKRQIYHHVDFFSGVTLYQSFVLFKGNRTSIGFDYKHFGGEAWYKTAVANDTTLAEKTPIINKKQYELAGYIDFSQRILSWLSFQTGVRFDWHDQTGINYIPQASLTFNMRKQSKLALMVKRGFRNPTIRELYMYRPANSRLKAESLMNYEISYSQHTLRNRLFFQTNLFFLQAKNMISQIIDNGIPLNVNTGKMKNIGWEVEIGYHPIHNLIMNANYSFLYMSNPQLAAPEHMLNISLCYSHNRFTISTDVQYINGLYLGVGNAKEKENYTLWDVHFKYRVWRELWVNIKTNNVLGEKYQINKGFPMPRTTIMGGLSWRF